LRISTIRSAAIGAAVGVGFLAVGSARADDNSSTICVATTTTAPTSAAAAPTTAAVPAPIALGPGATVQQFQAALVPVVGPTTDIGSELVPLGLTAPAGIPTPEGTTLEDISVYYYPDVDDPARSSYDATMTFTATVPAADMITMFQTELTAAGYIQTADSVENEEGRQERWLTYDIPDSAYENAELVVAIVDGDSDFAQLEIRHALDPAAINIFSSWATGLPLVDQATEIYDASLRLNNYGSNYEASVRTSWTLPIPAADAHAQLLAALLSTPYTIDPDYEADDNTVYLVGGEFLTLSVSTNEGYPEDTSTLSASATFDIQL
jgi:hypothetical protein